MKRNNKTGQNIQKIMLSHHPVGMEIAVHRGNIVAAVHLSGCHLFQKNHENSSSPQINLEYPFHIIHLIFLCDNGACRETMLFFSKQITTVQLREVFYGEQLSKSSPVPLGASDSGRILDQRDGTGPQRGNTLSVGSAERPGTRCRSQLLYAQL